MGVAKLSPLATVSLSLNVAGGYPTLTPLDDARARVQVQNASAARCLLGFTGNHKFTAEL